MKDGYVYILSNQKRNVLYIGVTNDLRNRIKEHQSGKGSQFAFKYKCFDLIYFEWYDRITDAIDREKQLKKWHREWKWNLIKGLNPELKDLSGEID